MNWTFLECQVGSPKEGLLGYIKVNVGSMTVWLNVKKGKEGKPFVVIPSMTRNDGATFDSIFAFNDPQESKKLCMDARTYFENYREEAPAVVDVEHELPF